MPSKKPEVASTNLQEIKGVGPRVAEWLSILSIATFVELAQADVDELTQSLIEISSIARVFDIASWIAQAQEKLA